MRHHRHITFALAFLTVFAAGQAVARQQLDDSQIRQQIIQESGLKLQPTLYPLSVPFLPSAQGDCCKVRGDLGGDDLW